ncbi:MAG TPA: hypothetical protein VK054_12605, partial [Beutenbergiaceae bacterium]|nr:hypothetical protein [Beutenbergiaceae bacterium]
MNRTEGAPNNKQPAAPARPPRPPRTTINPDGIPTHLKQLNQWLIWRHRFDERRQKWTKVPYQAKHRYEPATSTDADTWATFQEALDAYAGTPDVDGIGFAVTKNNNLTGVDLDNMINPDTGEINPFATEVINNLNSYTEITPSGMGYRIWVQGNLEKGSRDDSIGIEVYDDKRYFTVTGDHLPGTPTSIATRQVELTELYNQVFPPTEKRNDGTTLTTGAPLNLSDEEIIRNAIRSTAKNGGEVFDRLYRGDDSDYANDASSADLAFAEQLHFQGATPDQIDRIYRNSGRARGKWDSPRGDTTYGRHTIERAQHGRVRESPAPTDQVNLTIQQTDTGSDKTDAADNTPDPKAITYSHLAVDTSRYAINLTGVYPVKLKKEDGEWSEVTDYQAPIAGRPIWPNAIGTDVTDNNHTHVQLAWYDAKGNTRTKWVPHADLNDRTTIMNLDSAPVSYGRFARL